MEGLFIFHPKIHGDARGSFLEWFRGDALAESLGYRPEVAQANCSISGRGVVRGVHFADVPPGQAKYVTCVSGAVLDVIADLRIGSPSFGCWEAVTLDDVQREALYIGEGLGHAFMALSEQATVLYLCSTPYAPAREHGVHPLDPELGIAWPSDVDVILSEKDTAAPSLAEARELGLLPDYRVCTEYVAQLAQRQLAGAATSLENARSSA